MIKYTLVEARFVMGTTGKTHKVQKRKYYEAWYANIVKPSCPTRIQIRKYVVMWYAIFWYAIIANETSKKGSVVWVLWSTTTTHESTKIGGPK